MFVTPGCITFRRQIDGSPTPHSLLPVGAGLLRLTVVYCPGRASSAEETGRQVVDRGLASRFAEKNFTAQRRSGRERNNGSAWRVLTLSGLIQYTAGLHSDPDYCMLQLWSLMFMFSLLHNKVLTKTLLFLVWHKRLLKVVFVRNSYLFWKSQLI